MDGYWLYFVVVAGAFFLALIVLFITRAKKRKEAPPEVKSEAREEWPLKTERSVTTEEAKRAQDELRTLEVEREILSYAIRRLYEAEAEGKISEEERDRLAQTYKERMEEVKGVISRGGSVVALSELEGMREDLAKLFSERFEELNRKIEELRLRLEIEPVEKEPVLVPPTPSPPTPPPKKEKKKRRPPAPRKTEAEERIEKIREEIEKVLERLGQIEAEG